jgi:hypothetical protein
MQWVVQHHPSMPAAAAKTVALCQGSMQVTLQQGCLQLPIFLKLLPACQAETFTLCSLYTTSAPQAEAAAAAAAQHPASVKMG